MATIPPKPIPSSGLRSLSPKERLQRANALNCTIPKNIRPACTGQINVGIFFDGTGNNRSIDYLGLPPASRKHSNVVRLFNVFRENAAEGFFRHYIPGVGTPFEVIGDQGARLGGPFAWNGENRIVWGLLQLINTPHLFVNGTPLIDDGLAGKIANNLSSIFNPAFIRREALKRWQASLRNALAGKKPEVELINLYVFGFSRGSAEARAFSNWLFEVCERDDNEWMLAGIPIRHAFLGIFDTVASVGVPNSLPNLFMEGHQSWADGNMEINPAIEQCVHYVAGHEVRASFPLDSVRVRGEYPPNAREVMYPGSHSDLGGGYAPNDLGISPSIDSMLAKIPGAQMYHDSRKAGVPLKHWSAMLPTERAEFSPSAAAIKGFNAYLSQCKVRAAPVEEAHRAHMSLYLSYRYKYRNRVSDLPFYKRASPKDRKYIEITTQTILDRLAKLNGYGKSPADPSYSVEDAVEINRKMMRAAGLAEQDSSGLSGQLYDVLSSLDCSKLTDEIEHFFGEYIHDSMAGFIDMGGKATNEYLLNGQGIMRFRKIFKENG